MSLDLPWPKVRFARGRKYCVLVDLRINEL